MQILIALVIAIIVYSSQQKAYRELWDKNLHVDISFEEPYIYVGGKNSIIETISNDKTLLLPVVHVKYAISKDFEFEDQHNILKTDRYYRNDVFSIMGHQRVTREISYVGKKRGLFLIEGSSLIAKDFFMTKTYAKSLKFSSYTYVLPKKINERQLMISLSNILGDVVSRKSLIEDPYAFRGIREYDTSCCMNKINWKASARTEELMVNMFDPAMDYTVKIMLNLEPNTMLKQSIMQELCIEIASSSAEYFMDNKMAVEYMGNGLDILSGDCERVDRGGSDKHMLAIDKCLARIKGNAGLEHFISLLDSELKNREKNVCYFVVSAYVKDDLLLKLDALKKQGPAVYVLSPHYDIEEYKPERGYITAYTVEYDNL